MAKRNKSFETLSPAERSRLDGEKEMKIVKIALLSIFLLIELLLLVALPPAAIIAPVLLWKIFMPSLKQAGLFREKEKKSAAKKTTEADWKQTGQKAAQKYVSRVTESAVKEKDFKSHPHTPVTYSYDVCAKEKRLEQLRTLKGAGLLTEAEYRERRSKILEEQ